MLGRTLIVFNARSGALSREQKMETLHGALDRHGLKADIRPLDGGGEISAVVADGVKQGYETVVVGGGDGTLCAGAASLVGTGRTMGVLPMGTFNYFARSLGIDGDIDAAVAVLAQGQTRSFNVGEVNGRTFLNNASLGIYARILEQREDLYRRWGRSRIAAHISVLLSLTRGRAPLSLRVTVDGSPKRLRTPMVFIANNPYQLAEFGLAGAECLEQGCFAMYVAPDCHPIALLGLATKLVFGRLRADRDFELICGKDILVEA
ncbi:MAG: hypothetical protein JSS43_19600, partial [Proteobacteria bacterium]|nr:hypothetical protein [Pseudomonadota bacterium]